MTASLPKGVFDTGKTLKPFGAYVVHNKAKVYIGYFATVEYALIAIADAERRFKIPVSDKERERPPVDRIDRIRRSPRPGFSLPYQIAFEIGAETHPELMDRFLNEAYERMMAASRFGCRIADLPKDWHEQITYEDLV